MSLFPTRRPRTTRMAAILLASAIALTACGGQTTPDDTTSLGTATTSSPSPSTPTTQDANSLLPPAEGKTRYPLTLKTAWGSSVLEKRPERIATIAPTGMDTELALELGVTPVLSIEFSDSTWIFEAGGDEIEQLISIEEVFDSFPYEKVLAADPT